MPPKKAQKPKKKPDKPPSSGKPTPGPSKKAQKPFVFVKGPPGKAIMPEKRKKK